MSTLLLRIYAPLQSWGVASKFDTRDTGREPTKSGVIGLLAAALGRPRTEELNDLQDLRFGVRIDQPGRFLRDFHTARLNKKDPPFVTNRYYLADAVFLIGLEGEDNFLHKIASALQNPVFPPYLGRRSCPPVGQLVLGVRNGNLRQALEEEPWQACEWFQTKHNQKPMRLTIVCDAQANEPGTFLRRDLPVSFDQRHRRYSFRTVIDIAEAISIPAPQTIIAKPTNHDAMDWGG